MKKEDKKKPPEESQVDEQDEIQEKDFQFVLKELLGAYQPILGEELRRAQAPEQLEKEAAAHPPTCEDEFELANRIFEKFFTEEVALRLLPPEGRELMGPITQWNWCLRHLRCCFIFGWLVCRGPRNFRAFSYYLHRYWKCVRELLGSPVSSPLTPEERNDFGILIEELAGAFKPYLTDQLATVEFPAGIPDEVIGERIDCHEGLEEACELFERLLTPRTSEALLGREAFAAHIKEPSFWFCRCWCLCAMCFGCCLARAHTLYEWRWCLRYFFRCLRHCFKPLTCAIIKPAANDCAEEQYFAGPGVMGIEIVGTATGAFCDRYILEWKDPLAPPIAYTQTGIVYTAPAPPGGPGACGKVNATLGYLDTFGTPVPTDVEIRLTVFATQGGPCVREVAFQIFKKRVWIGAIEGVPVESPPGWVDPNARLFNTGIGQVGSFGTALEIWGHAWVGSCFGKEIKRYTLSYQADFVNDPTVGAWTQFWQVDYNSMRQKAAVQTGNLDLTSFWRFVQLCLIPTCPVPNPFLEYDELDPTRWISGVTPPAVPPGQFFPVDPELAPIWASQSLPPINCYSGKYTLRLAVEDTFGNFYYDTQHVWFDNKAIYGEITELLGVAPCAVLNLSQIPNAGNCGVVWPLSIQGIAYDEYILETDTLTHPSDNFGGYCLTLTKQGGLESSCSPILLSVALPVPAPASPTTVGTQRVGEPGTRCLTASPLPMGFVIPPKQSNTLTVMDARMFDATCAASASPVPPAGFALHRANPATGQAAECCAFFFALDVWDTSICPSLSGGRHQPPTFIWPIYICNDLPPAP